VEYRREIDRKRTTRSKKRNPEGIIQGGNMKLKNFIFPAVVFGLVMSTLSAPSVLAQEPQTEQEPQKKEFIPKEVKDLMLEGMDSRQARSDIPFEFFKLLYLRTSSPENLHGIFFFKCKNADLGFKDMTAPATDVEEKKQEPVIPTAAPKLTSLNNFFLHFKQLDGQFEKDVYVPFNQQRDADKFDAEAVGYYTVGYPLPAGDYLLAAAITSLDLQTIGIQYFEFSLPNPTSFVNELEITPIFFAKKMSQMQAVEMQTQIHKGYFTYGVYQIEPNLDNVFSVGEDLDIFFFIFGAQPRADDPNRVDVEINFEIHKDEQIEIRWAPQTYEYAVVSQPLPMKQTVVVKTTDDEGNTTEKQETRDLAAGKYTFSIHIKDNLSGIETTKTVPIEVK
jgi:hypothetical protein